MRFRLNDNGMQHGSESQPRQQAWIVHLPVEGFRTLCSRAYGAPRSRGHDPRVPAHAAGRDQQAGRRVAGMSRAQCLSGLG